MPGGLPRARYQAINGNGSNLANLGWVADVPVTRRSMQVFPDEEVTLAGLFACGG